MILGKGGAKANEETHKKNSPAHPTVAQHHAAKSDPTVMAHQAHQVPGGDAYSAANEDGRHRGAQAANQAAHAAAGNQRIVDHEELARIVAEDAENKNKLPRYPGLDRWKLIEKMGDGAFSNVYKARDLDGKAGEVAIKVVRKFEMNSNQVSTYEASYRHRRLIFLNRANMCGRAMLICIQISTRSNPRAWRCGIPFTQPLSNTCVI